MKIGDIDLGERPLLLAPMEDITDASFRLLCREQGADMVYTEFIPSDGLVRDADKAIAKLRTFDEEAPVGIQIYGHIPEWMVEVPNDLARNWIVMPRPEGHRYLVSCKRGKASIRSLSGYTKNIKTNLPGGQYASLSQSVKNRMNFAGNCILDVIIADTCVYAMDILVFNSTEYAESEAESRLFTLHSRVFDHCRMRSSSPKNRTISSSTKNSFLSSYSSPFIAHFPPERSLFRVLRRESPLSPCQHSQCSPQRTSFLRVLPFFLFSLTSSRFGKMEEGCTPLQLLWKDAQTATYVINTDAQGTILASQSVTVSKRALNESSYSTKTVLFARWKDLSSSRASWLRLTTIRFFAALWEAFARIQSDSNGN